MLLRKEGGGLEEEAGIVLLVLAAGLWRRGCRTMGRVYL